MSAPLAGKFQDHYEVLGVSPRATLDEIQQVCQQLFAKYDPVMGTEPDLEKFEGANLALEILSDADLRAQFDKLKGIEAKQPEFSGLPFFEGLSEDARLRSAMLCVLFDRRRENPFKPSLTMRQIERIIDSDSEAFILAAWYLKQRGMIVVDDKSHLEITVKGIDELEANPPSPDVVMAMIRPEGMAGYEPPEPEPPDVSTDTSTREAGETAEEGKDSGAAEGDALGEVAESGLQALVGAVSQEAGTSPETPPSQPGSVDPEPEVVPVAVTASTRFSLSRSKEIQEAAGENPAQSPAAPEEIPADGGGEAAAWSVSTPLGDPSAAAAEDTTQTLGGRLQGILGRPRYR